MTLDMDGLHHPARIEAPLDAVVEELSREKGLLLGRQLAHRWATDLADIAKVTARFAHLGKGSLNKKMIEAENRAILEGFRSLPRFPEIFEREVGVPLGRFCQTMNALAMLGYSRRSNVVVEEQSWFIRELTSKMGIAPEEVSSVLGKLDAYAGRSPYRPLIPLVGKVRASSFDHAAGYTLLILERVFYGPYDPDLRGRAFEVRCGRVLERLGYRLVHRHPIQFDETIRTAILNRLDYAKRGTDIDLLACRDNILLLLECKEIKPRTSTRSRKLLVRRIEDARSRLDLVAEWVAGNDSAHEQVILTKVAAAIGYDRSRKGAIIPIVVVNFEPKAIQKGKVPFLRFEQLQDLADVPRLVHETIRKTKSKGRWEAEIPIPSATLNAHLTTGSPLPTTRS